MADSLSRFPASGLDSVRESRTVAGMDERINILLVDDEPKNLTALETVLTDPGYRLVRAESADEALLALVAEEFALLILDIQMPGMNGFELAVMIKQRRKTAGIPIIFLTAFYSEDQHVLEGYSTGAVDFLHKPINPGVLRSKVAVFAELHRKTRQNAQANQFLMEEIGERHRAQEELRELNTELENRVLARTLELTESEARFRALAEDMPHLVWEADPEGRTTYRNVRWRTYTGLLGETGESWLSAVHPDDLPQMRDAWEKALETGTECDGFCRQQRVLDGTYRWFHVKAAPVRNQEGVIVRWVGTSTDIHEQRQAEEALRQADRRKDEFLAMLGHELRNPLAAIRHAVRMGQECGDDPGTREWVHGVIDRQSRQLARMVDDLLDVERINRGRIELRTGPLDLLEVLQRAIEAVRPLIDQKQHTFTGPASPGGVPAVRGDAARLEQVFVNLLTNAVKYTPEGGRIAVTVSCQEREIMVSVTDTGVGITPDLLPQVFDLFTQAHTSLDRSQGGLGIGLTVVKSLIEMHGGRVWARSGHNVPGSEFHVALPLEDHGTEPGAEGADGGAPAAESGIPASGAGGSGLAAPGNVPPRTASAPAASLRPGVRILVVDDHVDAARTLERLLVRRNAVVRLEHDGPGGLRAAREFRPEVLLLDLGLPGMDGYALARALREDDCCQDALFIAISGYAQAGDTGRSQEAGFAWHFAKPVDFPRLMEVIRERTGADG